MIIIILVNNLDSARSCCRCCCRVMAITHTHALNKISRFFSEYFTLNTSNKLNRVHSRIGFTGLHCKLHFFVFTLQADTHTHAQARTQKGEHHVGKVCVTLETFHLSSCGGYLLTTHLISRNYVSKNPHDIKWKPMASEFVQCLSLPFQSVDRVRAIENMCAPVNQFASLSKAQNVYVWSASEWVSHDIDRHKLT